MSSNNKHRGFFNKYRKQMPVFETLIKDLSYAFISLKHYMGNGFKHKSILVYPHYPSRGSTIYKVGNQLGYNVTNKPSKNIQFAVYWEYLTFREEYRFLEQLAADKTVINLHSRDISKVYVDAIHQEVFGYCTIVDPLTYHGKMVKKNDINAKHDGQIIDAPVQTVEEGYIYQILIDNSHSDHLVKDIRVPVVGEVLDFAYIKLREISERFKNTTINTQLEDIYQLFSKKELGQINAFCKKLNLEYGELDILRNNNDQKIYIVDINNTPQGPPANTSKKDAQVALNKIGEALLKLV